MLIKSLFQKDIARPINGVVKADQLDESSVWQELDEFVITQEIRKHLGQFFSAYLDALDHPNEGARAGQIGVWISGFFGSGKSHFIKVLSYLLENKEHTHQGETKRAIDFFQTKIEDPMLFADMGRAVETGADVILFNIDSKAETRTGRDALLHVFLKVLNECQDYSSDYPYIAHMERYLEGRGLLQAFHEAFARIAGSPWLEKRDAYEFNRDSMLEALSEVTGQSIASLEKWLDNAEENFPLTVENFAKWTKEYLDAKGPNHRLVFLVDEVGQFIGGDTHLMLHLQTLVEELGTVCGGRAWVVVTAQEDLDKILEEPGPRNDFSKIQGRFATRLSLSSRNVDEVIRQRLLAKKDEAIPPLKAMFDEKGDILRNQLTFVDIGLTLPGLRQSEDFVQNYPFPPYQFRLLQRVFESIRKAGPTGLHLAHGERSLLDAFQDAAKQLADEEIGVLAPLYRFYRSIEGFLETSAKRAIEQAADNSSLKPFDSKVLQVLFLIRYVDEMKGNVDNLVTLCVDRVDADRAGLRKEIEEGLQRLENETLIARNGDLYHFLTNEEQDISREIKNVELGGGEVTTTLAGIVFDDVLKGASKHRFGPTNKDFEYIRICDYARHGRQAEGGLTVSVITPCNDEYEFYNESKGILDSQHEDGQALFVLPNDEHLRQEVGTYVQTDKYLRTKNEAALPESTKRILNDLREENRQRRERLKSLVAERFLASRVYVAGARVRPTSSSPDGVLREALDYLVQNTFSKMDYIAHCHENPAKEIQAVLRSDDIGQQQMEVEQPENNPKALEELRSYVELCARASREMVLQDVIRNRFGKRPYGWPDMETALLIARLAVLGEIQVLSGGASLANEQLYHALTTPSQWRSLKIVQRKTADPAAIQQAGRLAKDLFGRQAPEGEDALAEFIREELSGWKNQLREWKTLADTGDYPGQADVEEGLGLVSALLNANDTRALIEKFTENETELRELCGHYDDLEQFHKHQRPAWDRLRQARERFALNSYELERYDEAAQALKRMDDILAMPRPYKCIREADSLIQKVEEVNEQLVSQAREEALAVLDRTHAHITAECEHAGIEAGPAREVLASLEKLKQQAEQQESLAHLAQMEREAQRLQDDALQRIDAIVAEHAKEQPDTGYTAAPKPRKVVEPSKLTKKTYLETPDDVQGFVNTLKEELESAIQRGDRVEIR